MHNPSIQGPIRTNMTDICFIPKPDTDHEFRTALAILNDADTWTITKQEISQGEELGSGNFGTVTKGMLRGTIHVAIKTLNENKNDKKNRTEEFNRAKEAFKKETQIMKKLNHPNLVKIYGIQMDSLPFQLVMEQCEKALKNHLEKYRVDGRKPTLDKDQPDVPTFGDLKEWCEQIALGDCQVEVVMSKLTIIFRNDLFGIQKSYPSGPSGKECASQQTQQSKNSRLWTLLRGESPLVEIF